MDYTQLQQQALESLNNGKYLNSISLYEQCLEAKPDVISNYWYLGLAYLLQGEESEAQSVWMSVFLAGTAAEVEIWTVELIQLLEFQAIQKVQGGEREIAQKIYSTIQAIDSIYQNEYLENNRQKLISDLFKDACSRAASGDYQDAINKYQQGIILDSDRHEVWYHLGMVYSQISHYQEAYEAIIHALEINESVALYYYSLGVILEQLENLSVAISAYQKAIELDANLVDAYNNLGNIWRKIGQLESAELIYHSAIKANPEHFGSYVNLGNILLEKNNFDQAIQVYNKARKLNPKNPDILYNLGFAFQSKKDLETAALYYGNSAYYQEEYEAAISHYQSLQTKTVNIYLNLADCYHNLKQTETAIKVCQAGLNNYVHESQLYQFLIYLYQEIGQVEEAITLADKACQLFPQDLFLKRLNQTLMPTIYQTTEEINFYRQRFSSHLEQLIQTTSLNSIDEKKNALLSLNLITNFDLHYQGKNDLELQKKYGDFSHKIIKANYPEWTQTIELTDFNYSRKIRVGYISQRLDKTGKLQLGWLKYCQRENFEIHCYSVGSQFGQVSQQFQIYSDFFYHFPENLSATCQQIIKDKIDILVFLEIIDPLIIKIANCRLAPIQCATWGHPVTTGLPMIDYFLSGEEIEPKNAVKHYSEKLILLPNLAMAYTKPKVPEIPKNRSDFNLDNESIIYLSSQALPKYLPQYDYLFPSIAQEVTQAKFIFFQSNINEKITNQFHQRLQKSFAKFNLNSDDYCLFLPLLNLEDYLNINLLADVFLDTLIWSGGFTSLDAIACYLPIVTCSGEFMRGCQSSGMLKIIDVTETIAANESEYITLAVRLGLDIEWRQKIVQKIRENHSILYEDKTCVVALEKFYQEIMSNFLTKSKPINP